MFTFIDRWFPDQLAPARFESRYQISSQMACVIVAFPIFLLVMRFIPARGGDAAGEAGIGRTKMALLLRSSPFSCKAS